LIEYKLPLKPIVVLLAAGCAVIITTMLAGCSHKSTQSPAATPPLPVVQTIVLSRDTMVQSIPVTGTLTALPKEEATLTPQVAGTLESLNISVGQSVTQGQLVAKISTQQIAGQILQAAATLGQSKLQVQQAEANAIQQEAQTRASILSAKANVHDAQATLAADQAALTGANAALTNAKQNLTRTQTLYGEGLVAQKELESAQLAVQTAQSQIEVQKQEIDGQEQTVDAQQQNLAAAKTGTLEDLVKVKDIQVAQQQVANSNAALDITKAQAALYSLHSPLSGVVTAVGASPGESVDTTSKIATVADLSRLQLTAAVPSSSMEDVHPGQSMEFGSDNLPGKVYITTVRTVSPQIDPASGTVPVLAIVDNSRGELADNMTVSVHIIEAKHVGVMCVPQTALINDPDTGARTIALIDKNNVLHLVAVKTGLVSGSKVEISGDITPGTRVAVSGQYGLSDGAKVTPIDSNQMQSSGNGP
jgi:RND family efflux transporter MFP subunit